MKTKCELTELINLRIKELVSSRRVASKILSEAGEYALLSGGKRIRPQMLLAVCGEAGLDVACAIEMIHTYSLIHDDLPCMDDDDFRRGKPSLHKAFGEANALLTGDFLLTYAFEVVANAPLPPLSIVSIIQSLSNCLGANGIVGGQVLDMLAKIDKINWSEYQQMTLQKTAALFVAPLECAAIIKNLDESEKSTLIQFGQNFGLIFQIHDDLEDRDTPSAVEIIGEGQSREMVKLLVSNSKHLLSALSNSYPYLEELIQLFDN